MATICDKCKHLWQRLGKPYCNSSFSMNCKYKKGKKQCEYFEEGENIKKRLSKSNGWWKKNDR